MTATAAGQRAASLSAAFAKRPLKKKGGGWEEGGGYCELQLRLCLSGSSLSYERGLDDPAYFQSVIKSCFTACAPNVALFTLCLCNPLAQI